MKQINNNSSDLNSQTTHDINVINTNLYSNVLGGGNDATNDNIRDE